MVSVGRLEPIKDHALLIDALSLIDGTPRPVCAAILGSGSLAQELRGQAARHSDKLPRSNFPFPQGAP